MSFLSTKSYDAALDANRSSEVNPPDQKFMTERLLLATNLTTNTTSYKYINMNGYKHLGIHALTSGATPTDTLTITIEASIQDDGTAPASCSYEDVTNDWFGVASWVDTDFLVTCSDLAVVWVRIKYVTSNDSGNDADLTLYVKKMY